MTVDDGALEKFANIVDVISLILYVNLKILLFMMKICCLNLFSTGVLNAISEQWLIVFIYCNWQEQNNGMSRT